MIEYIYAGPHGTHTPKSFAASSGMQAQAELGFIVVQMDGMGTSNRSKAFHDVAWQNIKDAGFPDRILWHQAFAAKNPWYDITRVGIYGGSAGGQNSMGALLFHPEFYKVAVSYAGCHDNRMDKIWWNEQWMGWPIGPQYCRLVERRPRAPAAGQDAADRRRARHQRRSVVDAAGRERAAQGEQEFRLADLSPARITTPAAAASSPTTASASGSTSSCGTCWIRIRPSGARQPTTTTHRQQ